MFKFASSNPVRSPDNSFCDRTTMSRREFHYALGSFFEPPHDFEKAPGASNGALTFHSIAGVKHKDSSMNKTITAVLDDLDALIQVWEGKQNLTMGEPTLAGVKAKRDAIHDKAETLAQARIDLGKLVDEANDLAEEGEQLITRGRSGVRAAFGPDSPEYAQVGGTRSSESKRGGGNKPGSEGKTS